MLAMFLANRAAMVASIVLAFVVLATIFGPMLYPVDPFEMVWAPFTPPGQEGFVLGTDYLGRDMLAALLNGGRVSLTIGTGCCLDECVYRHQFWCACRASIGALLKKC
jgi:peptide/nickel transport system permease protein